MTPTLPRYLFNPVPYIFISIFMMMIGNGLLNLYIGVRLALIDIPTWQTGLVMSGYYLGFVLGTITGSNVVSTVGHIRAFLVFAGMATSISLLHGLFLSVPVWFLLRMTTGFCFVGMYLVAESWLGDATDNQSRGRIFAMYTIIGNVGIGIGQILFGLEEPNSPQLIIYLGLCFSACLIPIGLTRASNPVLDHANLNVGIVRLFRLAPLGIVTAVCSGLIVGGYYALTPVFGVQIGLSPAAISMLMVMTMVGNLVFLVPIGKLSDMYDRRIVLVYVSLGIMVLAAVIGLFMPAGSVLFVLACIFGGLYNSLYALGICLVYDELDKSQYVAAASSMLLTWSVGAAAGPVIGSVLMTLFGANAFFFYLSVVALVLALIAIKLRHFGHEPAEQVIFVDVPRTSELAPILDPRTDAD